jgi:hypothetical protein
VRGVVDTHRDRLSGGVRGLLGRLAGGLRQGGEGEELGPEQEEGAGDEEEEAADNEDDVMVVVEGESGTGGDGTQGPETQRWE